MIGILLMCTTSDQWLGVAFVGMAIWVMMFNESVLLSKVHVEMASSLESLRKKQEIEVQNLLGYLRDSQLGDHPWSNIDAAKKYISKIGLPAVITDSGGACIAVNKHLTAALGYDKSTIGKLCHSWHSPASYGNYIQGIQQRLTAKTKFMHSRLVMIDINGKEHAGTVAIIMLDDMRTATGIWLPDDNGILKTI
jgi:hypothetical protein